MKKICLIDDDYIYRYSIKRMLKPYISEEHFQEYEDGQFALEEIVDSLEKGNELSELFLVDVNMPMMDGWEFLEEFEQRIKHLNTKPIIYMVSSSNSSLDTDKVKNFKCLDGYLVKPVDPEFIAALLN